jgi:multimeric flavodoxin WrbA
MKIISLFGGPRKKGNTSTVLGWVESALEEKGHEVTRLKVGDYNVLGCISCYTCQTKPDEPGCPLKDEAMEIFDQMLQADAIIYSTPLYCWSWSSQIKSLVDRHFCMVKQNPEIGTKWLMRDKPIALVATSAGPMEDNAELLLRQFDNFAAYLNAKKVNPLMVTMCTVPDAIPKGVRAGAAEMAEKLVE